MPPAVLVAIKTDTFIASRRFCSVSAAAITVLLDRQRVRGKGHSESTRWEVSIAGVVGAILADQNRFICDIAVR